MQEQAFKVWLRDKYPPYSGTAGTRFSNCKRIEKYYGDLDRYYNNGNLRRIYSELKYSTDDERAGRPNPSKIPINGNFRNGLATLHDALSLYESFSDERNGRSTAGGRGNSHRGHEDAVAAALRTDRDRWEATAKAYLEEIASLKASGGVGSHHTARLQAELAARDEIIRDLRAKGRRVVVQRDSWEEKAKSCEIQLATLKADEVARLRRVKVAIARVHPDKYPTASEFERKIRTNIFAELWSEIEKTEDN